MFLYYDFKTANFYNKFEKCNGAPLFLSHNTQHTF
jgi:hypothetical protein